MTQVFPRVVHRDKQIVRSEQEEKSRSKKVLILICAYNEEDCLPILLDRLGSGRDILVIDDGSNDRTAIVATRFGANIISHEKRQGKAASLADGISYALQNSYGYVVEIGADAIPQDGAIEKITERLDQEKVGAVSCKQIPVGKGSMANRIDELIWGILAEGKDFQMRKQGSSHLGAVMFGFKPQLVDSIEGSVNDDEEVGISINTKGYRIEFRNDVIAYFDASGSIGHILERRKRMYYGHMRLSESTAPSMQMSTSSIALTKAVISNPRRFVWVFPTLFLDMRARLLAWKDSRDPNKMKAYSRWVTTYAKDNSLVIRNSSD